MNSFRLMHLFRHLTQSTACPNCNALLLPENITVDASLKESALLTVHCNICMFDMGAHVYINMSDPEILEYTQKESIKMSEKELQTAQVILKNHKGSLSDLFSQKL